MGHEFSQIKKFCRNLIDIKKLFKIKKELFLIIFLKISRDTFLNKAISLHSCICIHGFFLLLTALAILHEHFCWNRHQSQTIKTKTIK